VVVSSWSLLFAAIIAALRQKFHLSSCPDFRDRLYCFTSILKADEEREFPLIFRRSELLDDDCKDIAPFVMIVSWRRNSSYWLPQIPKIIFSSARAMRSLKSAK